MKTIWAAAVGEKLSPIDVMHCVNLNDTNEGLQIVTCKENLAIPE